MGSANLGGTQPQRCSQHEQKAAKEKKGSAMKRYKSKLVPYLLIEQTSVQLAVKGGSRMGPEEFQGQTAPTGMKCFARWVSDRDGAPPPQATAKQEWKKKAGTPFCLHCFPSRKASTPHLMSVEKQKTKSKRREKDQMDSPLHSATCRHTRSSGTGR